MPFDVLNHPSRWRALALALLLLGGLWAWAARVPGSQAEAGRMPSPREGFPAPVFSLPSLDGSPVALADQRGSVVIVNVWASWCGPCRAEMPAIQEIYQARREAGLQVLAVNSTVQDSAAKARAFVQEIGVSLPVLLDEAGEVTSLYRVRALPTTFVIDRKGVIRTVIFGGPVSATVLQTKVDELLAEAP